METHGVRLEIVPAQLVRPHEIADPGREQRIEARLRSDRILRDPLLVGTVPDLDGFVLLDGTNRRQALANLGLPLLLVQVLDYADPHQVELRTWCHAAPVDMAELLDGARSIPGVEVDSLPPLAAAEALRDRTTLAVVLDRTRRYVLTRLPGTSASRPQQLQALVGLYEDRMVRQECEPDAAEERAMVLAAGSAGPLSLVAFPPFLRSQVVAMAMQGTPVPAGISRHVIAAGRALRVNLPLAVLNDEPDAANHALRQHVASLRPRRYAEPTILFDS